MTKVVSLRMPEELHRALVEEAQEEQRSLNGLCVHLLTRNMWRLASSHRGRPEEGLVDSVNPASDASRSG